MSNYQYIQLACKPGIRDVAAEQLAEKAHRYFGIETGAVKSSKIFTIGYSLTPEQVANFAGLCLADEIVNELYVNELMPQTGFESYIAIAKLPGVTDDEGISAQKALSDYLNTPIDTNTQHIFSQEVYYLQRALSPLQLQTLAQAARGR